MSKRSLPKSYAMINIPLKKRRCTSNDISTICTICTICKSNMDYNNKSYITKCLKCRTKQHLECRACCRKQHVKPVDLKYPNSSSFFLCDNCSYEDYVFEFTYMISHYKLKSEDGYDYSVEMVKKNTIFKKNYPLVKIPKNEYNFTFRQKTAIYQKDIKAKAEAKMKSYYNDSATWRILDIKLRNIANNEYVED